MSLEEYLKNKKVITIHLQSFLYGAIIGIIIGTAITTLLKPITFAEQMGCEKSITIETIKGHVITSCDEEENE